MAHSRGLLAGRSRLHARTRSSLCVECRSDHPRRRAVGVKGDGPALFLAVDGDDQFARRGRKKDRLVEDQHVAAGLADGNRPAVKEQVDRNVGGVSARGVATQNA